ncbi:MAG: lipase secretion chaperone [Pseudomonadota bacterium]
MPMRRSARVSLGLLSLALVGGGLLAWWPAEEAAVPPVAVIGPVSRSAPFVRSMQDTLPDGNLQSTPSGAAAGASGMLPYGELKRLFDYYLSAVGEQSVETITLQIRNELDRKLPLAQAKKAQRLLGLYIEFKRELVRVESQPQLAGNSLTAVRGRLLAMQDLRSRYFSVEETQGMFGFEDAYDMDAVARLEVSQNPALNAQQKKQQLAALDAAMPENLRKERDATSVVVRVEQQANDMRAKGASEDDIYRMRAKEFDPQAASRLAEVDRDELAWKGRITRYQEERSKLLKTQSNASESERESSLAQLKQSLFSEEERPRLVAYE